MEHRASGVSSLLDLQDHISTDQFNTCFSIKLYMSANQRTYWENFCTYVEDLALISYNVRDCLECISDQNGGIWYSQARSKPIYMIYMTCPGNSVESGGTYDHSPPPEPPYLGKRISKDNIFPYLGYWLPLAITKKKKILVFSGNLPETTAKKTPPFWRKWERACGPLMHSSGGPGWLANVLVLYYTLKGKFSSGTEF